MQIESNSQLAVSTLARLIINTKAVCNDTTAHGIDTLWASTVGALNFPFMDEDQAASFWDNLDDYVAEWLLKVTTALAFHLGEESWKLLVHTAAFSLGIHSAYLPNKDHESDNLEYTSPLTYDSAKSMITSDPWILTLFVMSSITVGNLIASRVNSAKDKPLLDSIMEAKAT